MQFVFPGKQQSFASVLFINKVQFSTGFAHREKIPVMIRSCRRYMYIYIYIYIHIWRVWFQNAINSIKKKKNCFRQNQHCIWSVLKIYFFILRKMRYPPSYSVMFSPFLSKPRQTPVSLLCRMRYPLNQSQRTIPRTVDSKGSARHPSFPHLLWDQQANLWRHDKSHVIIMRISSVKPVLWLIVHLHHVLSDGYTEITDKLCNITFIIANESYLIMNAILRSLSV